MHDYTGSWYNILIWILFKYDHMKNKEMITISTGLYNK